MKFDLGLVALFGLGLGIYFILYNNNNKQSFATFLPSSGSLPPITDPRYAEYLASTPEREAIMFRDSAREAVYKEPFERRLDEDTRKPALSMSRKSSKPHKEYCLRVVPASGTEEARCIYSKKHPYTASKQYFTDLFASLGFRPMENIPDDDPRWAQIDEYRRRRNINSKQKNLLIECYTHPGNNNAIIDNTVVNGEPKQTVIRCPPGQKTMTQEQYIQKYYRPISTADLDALMKEIAIEENGGIENYEYNKRRSGEVSKMMEDYTVKKMEENRKKMDACWNAYRATWGGDERPKGSKSPDCWKMANDGLGSDAPWRRAVEQARGVPPKIKENSVFVEASQTVLGAYGGRLTKRRDYV